MITIYDKPYHICKCGKTATHLHLYQAKWNNEKRRFVGGQWILQCNECPNLELFQRMKNIGPTPEEFAFAKANPVESKFDKLFGVNNDKL